MTGSDTASCFTSGIGTAEAAGVLLTHSVPFKSSVLFPVDCSLLPPKKAKKKILVILFLYKCKPIRMKTKLSLLQLDKLYAE